MITDKLGKQMSPNAFWALARAIRAAGLDRATLGTDDARLAGWLGECKLDQLKVRYCPQLFNEIRLIKTEPEIEILRHAAHINEMALLVAADSMREGATWDELETMYMLSMAQQGGRGVYLMCGVGELPAAQVRRGEPVFFDALGQYRHYHGDFGRCAVVGEPSAFTPEAARSPFGWLGCCAIAAAARNSLQRTQCCDRHCGTQGRAP